MPTIDMEAARARYEEALRRFEEASAVISAHLAARTLPTESELLQEEHARSDLVEARHVLWSLF